MNVYKNLSLMNNGRNSTMSEWNFSLIAKYPLIFLLVFLFSLSTNASNKCSAPNDEDYAPFAEDMPSPDGGMAALIKGVRYPDMARKAGIQGKVFVLVYVNERGGVDDVKIVKGLGAGCDEAAISAVKKAKFIPGKSKGQAVKTKLSLALTFKL